MKDRNENIHRAAEVLLKSNDTTAYTGAGISVEMTPICLILIIS